MRQLPRAAQGVWLVVVVAGLLAIVYSLVSLPGTRFDVLAAAILTLAALGSHFFTLRLPSSREHHGVETVLGAPVGGLTRGYATFNLGYALLKVGRCAASLPYFRKALAIEAPEQAPYIRPRIRQAKRCVQRGASGPAPSHS